MITWWKACKFYYWFNAKYYWEGGKSLQILSGNSNHMLSLPCYFCCVYLIMLSLWNQLYSGGKKCRNLAAKWGNLWQRDNSIGIQCKQEITCWVIKNWDEWEAVNGWLGRIWIIRKCTKLLGIFPLKVMFCPLKWHMAPVEADTHSERVSGSL